MQQRVLDCVWNVMSRAQKLDFVFRRNGWVHLNRQGRQFSRLLAAEVCASAVVMLDTPYSEVVWRVLALHSIRQFPLNFPSHASRCAITIQLDSTFECCCRSQQTGAAYYWKSATVTRSRNVPEDGFGGPVVSMLTSGTQVRRFKPGRSRWIFTDVKILSMPSSGGEVKESVPCPSFAACKRT